MQQMDGTEHIMENLAIGCLRLYDGNSLRKWQCNSYKRQCYTFTIIKIHRFVLSFFAETKNGYPPMKLFDRLHLLKKAFCFFVAILIIIHASAQLNANFTATIQQGCSPLVVQFTELLQVIQHNGFGIWAMALHQLNKIQALFILTPGNTQLHLL